MSTVTKFTARFNRKTRPMKVYQIIVVSIICFGTGVWFGAKYTSVSWSEQMDQYQDLHEQILIQEMTNTIKIDSARNATNEIVIDELVEDNRSKQATIDALNEVIISNK